MVKHSGQLPPVPAGVPAREPYQTANALHSAAVRLLRRASTADVHMNLDGPRASVLSILVFAGPQPVGRLAAMEHVTAPAITKTVTALETAGLVRRFRSTSDRRVVLVEATARGREVLERGRAARVELLAGMLAALSERDRRTLARAAQIIAGLL
ncbi:MAG TPA: MarR family transcriptional regulator [Micromonosporaceae bacterium]|nr:MarR family transcriptional regulator [Micromonosporaceae bacterium]